MFPDNYTTNTIITRTATELLEHFNLRLNNLKLANPHISYFFFLLKCKQVIFIFFLFYFGIPHI